jgi:hypothetical protein
MWAIDFCAKRSSHCIEMAEECDGAERRRAWLNLAREWVKLSEDVIAGNYGRPKCNLGSEPQGEPTPDA